MLYATGSGADIQKPLAVVVMGGLITSTLLTLVVLPMVYDWFESRATEREIGGDMTKKHRADGAWETRGGSSPPFGTILETKGIPVKAGVPFSMEKARGEVLGKLITRVFRLDGLKQAAQRGLLESSVE